ncbi:MAG: VOC family protein, partial [Nitrospirota bacterium]
VEDVDKEYNRLLSLGLTAVVPLEDHPWGDRGFGVIDPNGIILYFYKVIEPTEEFKKYYK